MCFRSNEFVRLIEEWIDLPMYHSFKWHVYCLPLIFTLNFSLDIKNINNLWAIEENIIKHRFGVIHEYSYYTIEHINNLCCENEPKFGRQIIKYKAPMQWIWPSDIRKYINKFIFEKINQQIYIRKNKQILFW